MEAIMHFHVEPTTTAKLQATLDDLCTAHNIDDADIQSVEPVYVGGRDWVVIARHAEHGAEAAGQINDEQYVRWLERERSEYWNRLLNIRSELQAYGWPDADAAAQTIEGIRWLRASVGALGAANPMPRHAREVVAGDVLLLNHPQTAQASPAVVLRNSPVDKAGNGVPIWHFEARFPHVDGYPANLYRSEHEVVPLLGHVADLPTAMRRAWDGTYTPNGTASSS